MFLILYHISVLAGPDVQYAEKNDRGEKGEVSWQKSFLVIKLGLLWSSIDTYDGRVDRGWGIVFTMV